MFLCNLFGLSHNFFFFVWIFVVTFGKGASKKFTSRDDSRRYWVQLGEQYEIYGSEASSDRHFALQEAIKCYKKALLIQDNDNFTANVNLADIMLNSGKVIEAHSYLNAASSTFVSVDHKLLWLRNKARAFSMMGLYGESLDLLRTSIELDPLQLDIYLPYIKQAEAFRSWDESFAREMVIQIRKSIEQYVRSKSIAADTLFSSFGVSSTVPPSAYFALFEALCISASSPDGYRMAWRILETAHKASMAQSHSQSHRFPEVKFGDNSNLLNTLLTKFHVKVDYNDVFAPIFLVGVKRSGAAFLSSFLMRHEEIGFFSGENDGNRNLFLDTFSDIYSDLVKLVTNTNLTRTQAKISKYASRIIAHMRDASNRKYTDDTAFRKSFPKRILDGTLYDIRYITVLRVLFPNATFINIVRDPMDNIFSLYKHHPEWPYSEPYLRWRHSFESIAKEFIDHFKYMHALRHHSTANVIDISYESLVFHPEETLKGLINRLGLDWDLNTINFSAYIYKEKLNQATRQHHMLDSGIYSSSVGQWTMFANELAPLIDILIPQVRKLRMLQNALPFLQEINWDADPTFNYGEYDTTWGDFSTRKSKSNIVLSSANFQLGKITRAEITAENLPLYPFNYSYLLDSLSSIVAKRKLRSKLLKKSKRFKRIIFEKKLYSSFIQRLHAPLLGDENIDAVKKQHKSNKKKNKKSKKNRFQNVRMDSTHNLFIQRYDGGIDLMEKERYKEAIEIFRDLLLENNDETSNLRLDLSIALFRDNQLDESFLIIEELIQENNTYYDAYRVKCEMLTSLRRYDEAIEIAEYTLARFSSNEIMFLRATNYYYAHDYINAMSDFIAFNLAEPNEFYSWTFLGKCQMELGYFLDAKQSFKRSLELEINNAEVLLDLALVNIELGFMEEAQVGLHGALTHTENDSSRIKLYIALFYTSIGQCKATLSFLNQIPSRLSNETSLLLSSYCNFEQLQLLESINSLNLLVNDDTLNRNGVWYLREVYYFLIAHLDKPLSSFNLNRLVRKDILKGWVEHSSPNNHLKSEWDSKAAKALQNIELNNKDIDSRVFELLSISNGIEKCFQLDTYGFLPNFRKHRMFALAVLDITQQLRQHVAIIRGGGSGLLVENRRSSAESADLIGNHVFSFRDLFDVAVKWRFLAEPNIPIIWVDNLSLRGLKTMIVVKNKSVTKYEPYYELTVSTLKELMISKLKSDEFEADLETKQNIISDILNSRTLSDLLITSGNVSFLQMQLLCTGLASKGTTMQGYDIVVERVNNSFNLGLYMSHSAIRTELYSIELQFTFDRLVAALSKHAPSDEIISLSLDLFYYWINFMPLARGTSAVGYAVLVASILASGETLTGGLPPRKQLDWEAMLSRDPAVFKNRVRAWLSKRMKSIISTELLDGSAGYSLSSLLNTPRDILRALADYSPNIVSEMK